MAPHWLAALGLVAVWGCDDSSETEPAAVDASIVVDPDGEPRPERPDSGVDAAPDAGVQVTIRVIVQIDGRSRITLTENTAQWEHFDNAAPGRHNGTVLATVVNGVDWFPVWPDVPNSENRNCNCSSDVFDGVAPGVPRTEVTVDLRLNQARSTVQMIQNPLPGNDFTAIVEINDNGPGGSGIYDIEIDFIPAI